MSNDKVRIVIVRHGTTAANKRNKCLGLSDAELSPEGRREAGLLALSLFKTEADFFDRIYSSPLRRAVHSAAPINRINLRLVKGSRVICEPALIERDWGDWEGMSLREIEKRFPKEYAEFDADKLNYPVPGGEPSAAVQERVNDFLARVLREYEGKRGICMVTHLGTARHIISRLLGLEPEKSWSFGMKNSAAAEILYDKRLNTGVLCRL